MPVVLNSNQAYQIFMKVQGSCAQVAMWKEEKGLIEEQQEADADERAVVARSSRSSKRRRQTALSDSDSAGSHVCMLGCCALDSCVRCGGVGLVALLLGAACMAALLLVALFPATDLPTSARIDLTFVLSPRLFLRVCARGAPSRRRGSPSRYVCFLSHFASNFFARIVRLLALNVEIKR